MRYSIVLIPEPEEGGYSVIVPALPGCVTQAETVEECLTMAQEAIAGWIEVARTHGEPVPLEIEKIQTLTVDVDATAA